MSVQKISFAKALNTALADALETDPSVLVFGEDVGTSVAFSASPTA